MSAFGGKADSRLLPITVFIGSCGVRIASRDTIRGNKRRRAFARAVRISRTSGEQFRRDIREAGAIRSPWAVKFSN
jgi:hypothetical protein